MKASLLKFFTLISILTIVWLVSIVSNPSRYSEVTMHQVKTGLSQAEILSLLGPPNVPQTELLNHAIWKYDSFELIFSKESLQQIIGRRIELNGSTVLRIGDLTDTLKPLPFRYGGLPGSKPWPYHLNGQTILVSSENGTIVGLSLQNTRSEFWRIYGRL